jgi:hypothetical protein
MTPDQTESSSFQSDPLCVLICRGCQVVYIIDSFVKTSFPARSFSHSPPKHSFPSSVLCISCVSILTDSSHQNSSLRFYVCISGVTYADPVQDHTYERQTRVVEWPRGKALLQSSKGQCKTPRRCRTWYPRVLCFRCLNREPAFPRSLQRHCGFTAEKLMPAATALTILQARAPNSSLPAVFKKYSQVWFPGRLLLIWAVQMHWSP